MGFKCWVVAVWSVLKTRLGFSQTREDLPTIISTGIFIIGESPVVGTLGGSAATIQANIDCPFMAEFERSFVPLIRHTAV